MFHIPRSAVEYGEGGEVGVFTRALLAKTLTILVSLLSRSKSCLYAKMTNSACLTCHWGTDLLRFGPPPKWPIPSPGERARTQDTPQDRTPLSKISSRQRHCRMGVLMRGCSARARRGARSAFDHDLAPEVIAKQSVVEALEDPVARRPTGPEGRAIPFPTSLRPRTDAQLTARTRIRLSTLR